MISIQGFQSAFRYFQLFKEGLVCTVTLSFMTVLFGFMLALVLALMRLSRSRVLKVIATTYVEVFRATPLMVQLFLVYYVLLAGIREQIADNDIPEPVKGAPLVLFCATLMGMAFFGFSSLG